MHFPAAKDREMYVKKQDTAQPDETASVVSSKMSAASTAYSSKATPLGKKIRHSFVPIDPERINRELHEERVR